MQLSHVIFLTTFSVIFGCGQLPQGQVSTINFTVRGTILPAEMVTGTNAVQLMVPSINPDQKTARALVMHQILVAIEGVLEQQGRGALLPDALISQILQQLNVSIDYTPLHCVVASTSAAVNVMGFMPNMPEGCYIIDGLVVTLCAMPGCMLNMPAQVKSVPSNYMMFTGSLKTSNIIMANWSRQMWQSILGRLHRRLSSASTPFGMFFSRATVTLDS